MRTIFDSVVTKENDHTNLLRNVMERHPQAAASALSYLLDREIPAAEAAAFDFRTQRSFLGPGGREVPDLFVERQGFRCLIEAKIDPELELTSGQLNGYQGCFEPVGERHLCFLVPDDWKHPTSVVRVREALHGTGIAVTLRDWRGLIATLNDASQTLDDPILVEAVSFWKWRFEILTMLPQEKELLHAWSGAQYSAFRKLEKSIDQAKKLFDARGYETELEASYPESYGFYIKRARAYLLWLGIWTESPRPLSYGFHPTRPSWRRPTPIPAAPLHSKDGYHLWPLDAETWDNPEKIFLEAKSFLDSQRYD